MVTCVQNGNYILHHFTSQNVQMSLKQTVSVIEIELFSDKNTQAVAAVQFISAKLKLKKQFPFPVTLKATGLMAKLLAMMSGIKLVVRWSLPNCDRSTCLSFIAHKMSSKKKAHGSVHLQCMIGKPRNKKTWRLASSTCVDRSCCDR